MRLERRRPACNAVASAASNDYDSTTPAPDDRFASVCRRDACVPVASAIRYGKNDTEPTTIDLPLRIRS
ncbi:MAG: hypothetical protein DMF63_18805 [Acidobacteria bacterium]|nr:MAG: hypothetical protein DMF63_18805 [Acidobacteriota bacterium]